MVSLKNKQSGFTLVELLIVIVVIGILAALVITTFAGVQQRARNSERQTDINAIAGQLEAYYATSGSYPAATDIANSTWRSANDFRIDPEAFADPTAKKQTPPITDLVNQTTDTARPGTSAAGYFYYTNGTRYVLSAAYEGTVNGQTTYVKQSN